VGLHGDVTIYCMATIENKHIPVVLGTARIDRKSGEVAEAVKRIIEDVDGFTSEVVDVKDHVKEAVTVPPWGEGGVNEKPTAWKEIVEKSHALVLVIPEYNHSFPGELKLLLDSLWDEYGGKAVGLVGVSAGTLGGARVTDHIKPVLIELKLHPIKESVNLAKVAEAFDEQSNFIDEKTVEYVKKMLSEISRVSTALLPSQN